MKKVFCPKCGHSSHLATIENTIGEWMYFDGIDEYGDLMWNGKIDFGESETVGVGCNNCDWEYRGEDWMSKLGKGCDHSDEMRTTTHTDKDGRAYIACEYCGFLFEDVGPEGTVT